MYLKKTTTDFHSSSSTSNEPQASNNDSAQAILKAIPAVLHKYLKPKNSSQGN